MDDESERHEFEKMVENIRRRMEAEQFLRVPIFWGFGFPGYGILSPREHYWMLPRSTILAPPNCGVSVHRSGSCTTRCTCAFPSTSAVKVPRCAPMFSCNDSTRCSTASGIAPSWVMLWVTSAWGSKYRSTKPASTPLSGSQSRKCTKTQNPSHSWNRVGTPSTARLTSTCPGVSSGLL
jgi:hypothetical protein